MAPSRGFDDDSLELLLFPDPLTGVIRDRARKLIKQAIEAELTALMAAFAEDNGPFLLGSFARDGDRCFSSSINMFAAERRRGSST